MALVAIQHLEAPAETMHGVSGSDEQQVSVDTVISKAQESSRVTLGVQAALEEALKRVQDIPLSPQELNTQILGIRFETPEAITPEVQAGFLKVRLPE